LALPPERWFPHNEVDTEATASVLRAWFRERRAFPEERGEEMKVESMGDLASSIGGTWYNELESQLLLEADSSGRLSGTLRSGVGEGPGHYPLTGFYSPVPKSNGAVLGFVVCWSNVHSLTAWTGHFHPDEDVITATWLLAGKSGEWRSTNIGHDLFSRTSVGNVRNAAMAGSSVPHSPDGTKA
jgi:hypothetical protein